MELPVSACSLDMMGLVLQMLMLVTEEIVSAGDGGKGICKGRIACKLRADFKLLDYVVWAHNLKDDKL